MICDECETVAHCMNNGCVPKTNVQQEPVATLFGSLPVYDTSPPAAQRTWVPLTDEEIQTIWRSSEHMNNVEVCRSIEAKLKEKNT